MTKYQTRFWEKFNKKYNCSGPRHLKSRISQRVGYQSDNKKYCITISIQKISSIHTILGSHELNSHGHF